MQQQTAGAVIGTGGYGCVFSPPLSCRGRPTRRRRRTNKHRREVSKLMTTAHAADEYRTITAIKRRIDSIPNAADYFLLRNITVCAPAALTPQDLRGMSRCNAFKDDAITAANINRHLAQLRILNMPDGGQTVDHYVADIVGSASLQSLNAHLIALILRGIVPMNRRGVYHCDIKSSNVLINTTDTLPRLIDWGLSNIYATNTASKTPTMVPKQWQHYTLLFNAPFGVVLFNSRFEAPPNNGNIAAYMADWVTRQSHYTVINNIQYMLHGYDATPTSPLPKAAIDATITRPLVTRSLEAIVAKYGTSAAGRARYLNDVYVYQVDVWGFLMIYNVVVEMLFWNYGALTQAERRLFASIRDIYTRYLFDADAATTRPDVGALCRELGALELHVPTAQTMATYSARKSAAAAPAGNVST